MNTIQLLLNLTTILKCATKKCQKKGKKSIQIFFMFEHAIEHYKVNKFYY